MSKAQNKTNNTKTICSLSHLHDWVEEQKKSRTVAAKPEVEANPNDACEFLYRGHSDKNYTLLPSAYRLKEGKSFRAVEYNLYQEMLRGFQHAFSEDKTTFERLIRMQHHGLPTRLLDLTQNPHVALFFACAGKEEKSKDGEILLFTPPRLSIRYAPSIPEHAWAGLQSPVDFLHLLKAIYTSFCRGTKSTFENRLETLETLQYMGDVEGFYTECNEIIDICSKEKLNECKSIPVLHTFINHLEARIDYLLNSWEKKFEETPNTSQNEKYDRLKILNFILGIRLELIKQKKMIINVYCKFMGISEEENANINSFINKFLHAYFVFPTLNNERIKRQQGTFLLFPPYPPNSKFDFPKALTPAARILIPAKYKQNLLEQLADVAITEGYLFPELEKQAQGAIAMYPERTTDAMYDAELDEVKAQVDDAMMRRQ